MNYAFDSILGEQLYRLLPEVYRTRDKKSGRAGGGSGIQDLAKYLDAHGHLLDLIHATLERQFKDALPKSCQDWLLPYFAQLLAVSIFSPDSSGKHAEIDHAVSWRQRKGTLKCAEEIAEAVGQMEVEIQEGWKRIAMTPRIGMPIIPAQALDTTLEKIDMTVPCEAIRHPTLLAATVDLRRPSRAVEAPTTNPAARTSSFGGVKQTWRQANLHGVPCFPGSFDDVSRRTVDIRTPDAINGHYHHKRLLAYAPPPVGLFPLAPIQMEWNKRNDSLYEHLIEEKEENGVCLIRNRTDRILIISNVTEENPEDKIKLEEGKNYRIENIHFSGTLLLTKGQLELQRVEAGKVQVNASSTDKPVLTAEDCLFNELSVGSGIARLDSCTVLGITYLKEVDVTNSILMDISDPEVSGTIQYSRVPTDIKKNTDNRTIEDCTSDEPVFFNNQTVLTAKAVLAPNTPKSIYAGASNGGEMGYFHHGREGRPVRIMGKHSFNLPYTDGYALKDLIFIHDIEKDECLEVMGGWLELIRVAVQVMKLKSIPPVDTKNNPLLKATDCLFDNITVDKGLARLEYCTVMKKADCKHMQASDCIFIGEITYGTGNEPESGCLRYSRIPESFDGRTLNVRKGRTDTNTRQTPVFTEFDYCNDGMHEHRIAVFGEPGYGVLASITPDAVRFGAEDGGEMGAYHHKYYNLKAEAMLDKMREFLPVGIKPVLIQDTRLLRVPPEQTKT